MGNITRTNLEDPKCLFIQWNFFCIFDNTVRAATTDLKLFLKLYSVSNTFEELVLKKQIPKAMVGDGTSGMNLWILAYVIQDDLNENTSQFKMHL